MQNKIKNNIIEMKEPKLESIALNQKFYTAKVDRAFKATLGHEEHKSMLEGFLGRILKKKLKIVKYLRNEQPVRDMKDKIRIVDLLVQ